MGQLQPIELNITKEDFLKKLNDVTYKVDMKTYTKENSKKHIKLVDGDMANNYKFIGEIGKDFFSICIIYRDGLLTIINEKSCNVRDLKNEIIIHRFNAKLKSVDKGVIIETYRSSPENIKDDTLSFLFPIYNIKPRVGGTWYDIGYFYLLLIGTIFWIMVSRDHDIAYSLYIAITCMILLIVYAFYKALTIFKHRKIMDQLFITMISDLEKL